MENNFDKLQGVVIVSISNLFHIFDKIRNPEQKKDNKTISLKHVESKKNLNSKLNSSEDPIKGINEIKQINTEQNQRNLNEKNSPENKNKNEKYICDYFSNLVIVLFSILVFNSCFLCILYFILSEQKNKYYCFEHLGKEFRICSKSDFCSNKGISNYIFTDLPSEKDINEELKNVNNIYKNFFIRESIIFGALNKKFSKIKQTLSFYNAIIIITKNEEYLYSNTFRTTCESNLQDFILVLFISIIIGNLLFGFLADIYGRKRILLILLCLQILGGIFLFIITILILRKGNVNSNLFYNDDNNMFNFDYNNMIGIVNYMEKVNLMEYDLTYLNNNYINEFNQIKTEVLSSTFIREAYKKNKIFVFFSFFFIFLSHSPIKTISMAYLMENALTKDSMSTYFLYINFTFPLSLLISSILITSINCFHIPILIISIIQFILFLIVLFLFYESQRFNFEYSYFHKITEFTEYYIGKENLRNFYSEKVNDNNNNINSHEKNSFKEGEYSNNFTIYYLLNSPKIKTELEFERQNLNANIWNSKIKEKQRKINQIKFSNEKENIIRRQAILNKPITIINQLMNKDKQIRNHSLIVYSFIISISIICEIIFGKITTKIFISRENLINKKLIQPNILIFFLFSFISLYPFIHYFVKYFGVNIILFPSLFIIIIFSGIYEIICLFPREQKNLNVYQFDSIDISYRDHEKGLINCIFLNLIGAICLRYCVYFYLTKLTKTIYRCSFYGKCQTIIDVTLIISFGVNQYIEKTFFYTSLFGIIGIINSYFITPNDDSLNISEVKEIIFDELKINNQNNN